MKPGQIQPAITRREMLFLTSKAAILAGGFGTLFGLTEQDKNNENSNSDKQEPVQNTTNYRKPIIVTGSAALLTAGIGTTLYLKMKCTKEASKT